MSFLHFVIQLFAQKTRCFNFWESFHIIIDDQAQRIFFLRLITFENIVNNNDFFNFFALRIETFL